MIGLLNLGSLLLGLAAWTLPIVKLVSNKGKQSRHILSFLSMSACSVSICLQIFNTNHLVGIGDWAALMDTSGALVFVVSVLLIITIVLNTLTLLVCRAKPM
jgi:cytochrome c oxidase subunit 4